MEIIDKPIDVDAVSFDDFIKKHPFIVIDCWSTRCPPCMMLAPIIDDLAKEHAGKVVFGKLSFDDIDNQQIAARFEINVIPTLLIFRDGKLADRLVGYRTKETLEKELGL